MFRKLDHRAGHYGLLLIAWAALCLPNLGGPSLWDIDEGNNAEAAREMWRAGAWIVPTCNYRMREDKPALLYWLQAAGYAVFGAGEFAARLPSALAALAAMLATYEFGRRLFNAATGLLAGLLLGSAVLFCASAHFANPDSLLNTSSLFALFFFWRDYAAGRRGWSPWSAAAAGLGVLAKGPVGLILPAAVAFLFLLWRWDLRRLWSLRLLRGLLVFVLVAAPWYVWVTVETKGAWTVGFWMHHNVNRFTGSLEGHAGPFYYYAVALLVGCAPWCVFFGPTAWYALRRVRRPKAAAIPSPLPLSPSNGEKGEGADDRPAVQFLVCWIAVYFLFFSASTTKLPNYILPLYPAAALLTGALPGPVAARRGESAGLDDRDRSGLSRADRRRCGVRPPGGGRSGIRTGTANAAVPRFGVVRRPGRSARSGRGGRGGLLAATDEPHRGGGRGPGGVAAVHRVDGRLGRLRCRGVEGAEGAR